jgi:hypothetical protein
MKKRKLKQGMMAILLFVCCHVMAQGGGNDAKTYLLTPEAAALAKMINYPVNHNTGIPDIRLPLYEIKVGGLTLPIELVYHAGGFKVNEQAGRAGLGWALSCDLQITRSINGIDDIGAGGYLANTKMKYIAINPPYNDPNSYPLSGETGKQNAYFMAINQEQDGMPDHFYYKLLHKSGSFYFRKDASGTGYSIVPVPYDDIKIVFDTGGSFTITDTDGSLYYFGYPGTGLDIDQLAQHGIECSGGGIYDMRLSAWKCMKIIAPNKTDSIVFGYNQRAQKNISSYQDRIEYYHTYACDPNMVMYPDNFGGFYTDTYEYLTGHFAFHWLSSPKYKVYSGGGETKFYLPYVNAGNELIYKEYSFMYPPINRNTTIVKGLSLNTITYRGGGIVFSGDELLTDISITEFNATKLISFSQSYQKPVVEDFALKASRIIMRV